MAGADCKNVVFLFTDLQIKDEAFLEDISMVLNTGEVPNLFATDEKTEILERVQVIGKAIWKAYMRAPSTVVGNYQK